jgi:hypothetical protein
VDQFNLVALTYVAGFQVPNGEGGNVAVHGILMDVTLVSPAKALWLQLKQFNGYCGLPKCKEKGEQHIIGIDKVGKKRQCHIYPYNASFPDGHCQARSHSEVRK